MAEMNSSSHCSAISSVHTNLGQAAPGLDALPKYIKGLQ